MKKYRSCDISKNSWCENEDSNNSEKLGAAHGVPQMPQPNLPNEPEF